MLSTFYVLHALAREWNTTLPGAGIVSSYSQQPDELSIAVERDGFSATLRAQFAGRRRYVMLDEAAGRARRNVADVLVPLQGLAIQGLRLADRDRILSVDLSDGCRLDIVLFGSAANAFLVSPDAALRDTFKGAAEQLELPAARSAETVAEVRRDLADKWQSVCANARGKKRMTTATAISRVYPLFNALLARECVHRWVLPEYADQVGPSSSDLGHVGDAISALDGECMDGRPRIVYNAARPVALSLVRLDHLLTDAEPGRVDDFDSVSDAVRVFVKMMFAWDRFDVEFIPIRRQVDKSVRRERQRLQAVERELARASRADEYERWGHVLMAMPTISIPSGEPGNAVPLEVPDPFGEAETVIVPVFPRLSAVENAQRYYDKARAARSSRLAASTRVESLRRKVERISRTESALDGVHDPDSWKRAKKEHDALLEPYLPGVSGAARSVPFRTFDLGSGFEVWVGRNAKQNDELTTRAARKFDLWLHARGVGGSHVLLRPPNRSAAVPEAYVAKAASVAAHFSKARGSALVPVVVAERKYVRKPRGGAPGTVLVDRHRVVMVEPKLPRPN